jgi:hypothetical protein
VAAVRARVVANEIEAELACSVLRDAGIKCFSKPTDIAAGRGDGFVVGGPFEVWVDESELARARELLPD